MAKNVGIKAFVKAKLQAGASRTEAWQSARAVFPHKIVSWSYVISIDNELRWGRATEAPPRNVLRLIPTDTGSVT